MINNKVQIFIKRPKKTKIFIPYEHQQFIGTRLFEEGEGVVISIKGLYVVVGRWGKVCQQWDRWECTTWGGRGVCTGRFLHEKLSHLYLEVGGHDLTKVGLGWERWCLEQQMPLMIFPVEGMTGMRLGIWVRIGWGSHVTGAKRPWPGWCSGVRPGYGWCTSLIGRRMKWIRHFCNRTQWPLDRIWVTLWSTSCHWINKNGHPEPY